METIAPVSEEVTFYILKSEVEGEPNGLCVDERNEANVVGVKGIYSGLEIPDDLTKPLRFDIGTLKKWLAFVEGDLKAVVSEDKIVFSKGRQRHTIPIQVIDESEEPKITMKEFPINVECTRENLVNALNELASVGETLEIALGEELILSAFNDTLRTDTPLKGYKLTKGEASDKLPRFNFDLVKSVMAGLVPFEKVQLWWGWQTDQPLPLVIRGVTKDIEVSYGISPRML